LIEGENNGILRKWQNTENLCCSVNNLRVIKRKKVRWDKHVACMGEIRSTKFESENPKGRD
jgi:hypothetical protein